MRAHLTPGALAHALARETLAEFAPRTGGDAAGAAAAAVQRLLHSPAGLSEYIGEAVSQLEHAAQAAHFAALETSEEDVVLASLLHDVGHLLAGYPQMAGNLGVVAHEKLGGAFLRELGFPAKTCYLVEHHVDAKRYLCAKMPNYFNTLSEASKGTLKQQGGVMTPREADEFEKHPLFSWIVKMRTWDEKAKVVGLPVKPVHEYVPMMRRAVMRQLAKQAYDRDGYVVLRDVLSPELKTKVVEWVTELQNTPPAKGKHMVYYETVNGVETLCRTENFLPFHEGLRNLLTKGEIVDVVSACLGEQGVVYKEKVNYKLPGGGGFPAHQDAPAFESFGASRHLTLNVAVDRATPENGCLEVSPGEHMRGLFEQNPAHGGLSARAEAQLPWLPVPLEVGDVVIFSSWLPHRSGTNFTSQSRRSLYVTYNGVSDGDHRQDYYEDKRKHFPQKIEREPGKDYSEGAKRYNLATPITG